MKRFRERKSWIVLIAVLLLLAACKGETPTAPPPGGGGTPGGGTTPPTGVSLTLATTNSSPLVDSSVTITATAKLNDALVPNGTAVEFVSSSGSLNGSGTAILRTTTNGISTVTLTATTTGLVRVSATVNNVTRSIDITFVARPVVDPPIATTPTISSITPSIGRPAGGQVIRIVGTNFKSPVRVLFDTGGPLPVEGSVQSVSDTVIEVITPPVNLGSGQELAVDVIVLTQAGSTTEQRVELADGFTYRNEQLTPIIHTVTPNSGPVTGGTRVTILGEGFQEPVQVLFDTAEARILNVTYGQILAETPAARDTAPTGSGPVLGPVAVLVRNINSNTSGSMTDAFLYKASIQITGLTPLVGSSVGNTQIVIDGNGFVPPVDVVIAGVRAQVIQATGTRVVVRTGPLPSPCTSQSGDVIVNNIVNGDSDIWGNAANETPFSYLAVEPRILTVTLPAGGAQPGAIVTAVVRDPGVGPLGTAEVVFLLADRPLVTSPNRVTVGGGDQVFTFAIPTNLAFPTIGCTLGGVAGTQLGPTDVALTFRNLTTDCQDIIPGAIRVVPDAVTNVCVVPPPQDVEQVLPIPPSCASAGGVAVAAGTGIATITFRNDGGRPLIINPDTIITGTHAGDFSIPPDGAIIAPGGTFDFEVTFDPSAAGLRQANVRFFTNDPDLAEQEIIVCLQGNGI